MTPLWPSLSPTCLPASSLSRYLSTVKHVQQLRSTRLLFMPNSWPLNSSMDRRCGAPCTLICPDSLPFFPVHMAVSHPFLGLGGSILACSVQAPDTTYQPLDPQSFWCVGSLNVQTSQCPLVLSCRCRKFSGPCVAFLFSLVRHGDNCQLITRWWHTTRDCIYNNAGFTVFTSGSSELSSALFTSTMAVAYLYVSLWSHFV